MSQEVNPNAAAKPAIYPDGRSFLASLKESGVQKPENLTVLAGLRAFLAKEAGVHNIPALLTGMMAEHARVAKAPINGTKYAEVQNLISRRDYAEILAAVNCKNAAQFVNAKVRQGLLKDVEDKLIPALNEFHKALNNYDRNFTDMMVRNAPMYHALGNEEIARQIPPGLRNRAVQLPDMSPVKNAAETVVVTINEVFAVWGTAAARVEANDAILAAQLLDNEEVMNLCGFTDKELWLAKLNIKITAEDIQYEQALAKFAWVIMELNKATDSATVQVLIDDACAIDQSIVW